ncbi:hypothetical protein E2C01_096043 [Portunus trituberculatus]|uniref:Uncharacterized protein n=1 Tax=Portunus trituberculatus TaxID=210409 RepID=A0A5B7K1R9_PORTR|nr:hypothetical protein [Portunus trituberculatus]
MMLGRVTCLSPPPVLWFSTFRVTANESLECTDPVKREPHLPLPVTLTASVIKTPVRNNLRSAGAQARARSPVCPLS